MADPFLGEIRTVSFDFAPSGWAFCDGQLLSIQDNQALFDLIGTTYGGDGQTNFALPDLRGRVPLHRGQGPGLSNYNLGAKAGTETVTLTEQQMPIHTHVLNGSDVDADHNKVKGNLLAITAGNTYTPGGGLSQMSPAAIGHSGVSQPHPNLQPYHVLNFIIALTGIFPTGE